jgi:hypothetical protein
MKKLDLTQLTMEELVVEQKKRKTSYTIGAFIVGMMIGCAVWSAVKNGFSFFIFVPFIFAYWFRNTKVDYDEIKKEIQSRKQ